MATLELIATSAVGLEAVVAREIKALGFEPTITQTGRIVFRADEAGVARANLWLRSADRVLLRLGTFEATDFGQLFDRTKDLPWEEWLGRDAAFPVDGRSVKSQLSSVPACQKIVKKAIAEKLKSVYQLDWCGETGPLYAVEVALLENQATLTIDTSGAGLHKRGYRTLTGEAQLKETMAAALVQLSFWRPERQLIDPFCGSGTIPIEAALIGRNLAPGLNRQFAAEAWPGLPHSVWDEARREARELARPDLPLRIIGTDIDAEALGLARYHAERAGVAGDIHFQQRDFRELSSAKQFGCVICNPPYGERMGESSQIETLYRSMPDVLRRLPTWSHYILTAWSDFEALVGQPADRRRKLYNARIECTYYQFHGPKPEGGRQEEGASRQSAVGWKQEAGGRQEEEGRPKEAVICHSSLATGDGGGPTTNDQGPMTNDQSAAPSADFAMRSQSAIRNPQSAIHQAFGGLTAQACEQAESFKRRLVHRARHLRRWPKRGITCYRLYDRDVPEVPLVVDRYEECLHLAEYDRPHERTPAEHGDWLDLMARTAGEVLDVPPGRVFMKRRRRQRGTSQYERFAEAGRTFDVHEGGLTFRVNLSDYLDTGLFLDHRITRSLVRDAANSKRFLNLFGYTGAFTVYAAAGGASATTTVDLSNTYLDWARENLRLNALLDGRQCFVRDDARAFLQYHRPGPAYELAVVDPPTFSNSKKTERDWDIQRDHGELLARLVELMSPGGIIFFSTNSRRFKFAPDGVSGVTVREISRQTVPDDFRNRRIHRCWRLIVG
ncbi:MAG TPA: bifunctional 23S rRNA (guanine(2069)-N(7))-methyltransferase RlmK/23S rRNA (guanine(2445)-N(2))-methyltransferase RlmL [Pirellulales bacterium]|nr:bifunctional 23S rRNA (guanine(2069)-N(7))-methyltransferase RlmK/23S rRNA (guanine(2445)-N(2))-methyltransferase RlmL [Pirellulales bacterium]